MGHRKRSEVRYRPFRALLGAFFHASLWARCLGDYLVYRMGLAGRFPALPQSGPLVRLGWWLTLLGSLLFLPALWVGTTYLLVRSGLSAVGAGLIALLLAAGAYSGMRWFNRAWHCVDCYSVGSARRLVGTCLVFQVFLGPRWGVRERQRSSGAVRAGCEWLERKAGEHGVRLRLVTSPHDLCILEDIILAGSSLTRPNPWRPYRREEDRVRDQVESLRPRLEQAVQERVAGLTWKPDSVCLIAHVPGRGIGFAMPARNDLSLASPFEMCVCGRRSSPATHAHEVLHLFGAPDLYLHPWRVLSVKGEADEGTARIEKEILACADAVTQAHFGQSIMCCTWVGMKYLTIDPITARAIGWRRPDREYMEAIEDREGAAFEVAEQALEGIGEEGTKGRAPEGK
jgi:hypothetical protein